MKKQQLRSEVPTELTWNLTDIYADDDEFKAATGAANDRSVRLAAAANDFANDAEHFLEAVQEYYATQVLISHIGVYAMLKTSQDGADPAAQQLQADADQCYSTFGKATAWFKSAVIDLTDAQLTAFKQAEPALNEYGHVLDLIRKQRGHVLPPDQEKILAALAPTLTAAEDIQVTLDDTDLTFGNIDFDGEQQELTRGLMSRIRTEADRPTRKQAAKQAAASYVAFQNTFAKTLDAHIHVQNVGAQLRHYDSARQMDMAQNELPETVYDVLLSKTHAHLDLLHRYYALRKRVLGLDKMYSYDLRVPLNTDAKPERVDYATAKEVALKALAPLGKDYLDHLRVEFASRWVDVPETKGKTTGGYEIGVYGVHPYILLNWADTYNDLSTLVHESGHAMQTVYSDAVQTAWDAEYPAFTAEIASTTNESLLNAYELAQNKADRTKSISLLTEAVDDFVGTLYRQAQFAEFEHFMYTTEANGTPLTAPTLNAKWATIQADYYGPAVTTVDWPTASWAQIPHFFYNYYMYQYATSKAIATTMAKRILTEGDPAVTRYKRFLSAGNSASPVKVLADAGVDILSGDYLDDAFASFAAQLEQLEGLLG
ncbi:oligoendopeptidase F [Lacticaseibacillus zhaodongensis]|uniref:oligoendopeptidase F n=1 Tax=Lacticaseibacillus zhaodongensis TaxID=2668065 RepID=UPI0012D2AB92|nr:oligoendopeptidase F [Lacticaseibacillus zhaodongensis]